MQTLPFTYRPIDNWPGDLTRKRRDAPFKRGWGGTLQLLDRELRFLNARQIVCQVALGPEGFRTTDGHPRASARPDHPGVILAFESDQGPLKFACDTFTEFPDNMRAIALGLEALRKVERYGITRRGEQYKGWSQLPSGTVMDAPMSLDEAWRVLCDLAEVADEYEESDVATLYRMATKLHHPDHGGDPDLFRRATEARDALIGEN